MRMSVAHVCVIGAANIDLVSYVPRLPRLGETLHGDRFEIGYGGKGANQAVMVAKLGGRVSLVAKLGQDAFGDGALKNLVEWGVDTEYVRFTDAAHSGVAPIAVDARGENAIIVVSGANDHLTPDDIEQARSTIRTAAVVVCQLEIPLASTLRALRVAKEEGILTILNPAPARPGLPMDFYKLSDVLCPNESETDTLLGRPCAGNETEAAAELIARGAGTVVLTLGERGCLVHNGDSVEEVSTTKVKPLDSTGAGDAFVGSLAYFLARRLSVREAAARANQIAAISVQRRGTQSSFPVAQELSKVLLSGGA